MIQKIFPIITIFLLLSPQALQADSATVKAKKTIDFVKQKAKPEISDQRIADAIKAGDATLKALYSQKPPNLSERITQAEKDKNYTLYALLQKEYLNDIVNISWALFADAINKNQSFTGGTIVVADPGQQLYKFLLNYVKAVNHDTSKIQHISNNPYAYQRESTHFGEFKKKRGYEQYGIETRLINLQKDIRKKEPTGLEKSLPINKVHLVFGNVTVDPAQPLTFIKWENFGLYGTKEALAHLGQLYKKKESGGRRENVPTEINKQFEALLASLAKAKLYPELEKEAKKLRVKDKNKSVYPIWAIYKTVQKIITKIGKGTNLPTEISAIKKLAEKLQKELEKFDHLDLRRGEEVIITKQEIHS